MCYSRISSFSVTLDNMYNCTCTTQKSYDQIMWFKSINSKSLIESWMEKMSSYDAIAKLWMKIKQKIKSTYLHQSKSTSISNTSYVRNTVEGEVKWKLKSIHGKTQNDCVNVRFCVYIDSGLFNEIISQPIMSFAICSLYIKMRLSELLSHGNDC